MDLVGNLGRRTVRRLEGFGDFDRAVMAVAREIKTANKQDSVLVIFDEVDAFLV